MGATTQLYQEFQRLLTQPSPPRFICEHFLRTVVIYRPGRGRRGKFGGFWLCHEKFYLISPPLPSPRFSNILMMSP